MFASVLRPAVFSVRPVRGYATLREIETRLKSIKNIQKITNTMKVVASTRLNHAQRAQAEAKIYGTTSDEVFKSADTIEAKLDEAPVAKDGEAATGAAETLVIVASSDKGLCGGVHTQLVKKVKQLATSGEKFDVVPIGEKAKAKLSSALPERIVLSFGGIGKDVPTFLESQAITDEIFKLPKKYSKIQIVFNSFKNAISFEPTIVNAYTADLFKKSPKFNEFEIEDDVLENFSEFSLANAIHWALVEGHACEIQARRTAMENASSNASDMISSYSILYNRTRQAVITNELVDIITGASSLE